MVAKRPRVSESQNTATVTVFENSASHPQNLPSESALPPNSKQNLIADHPHSPILIVSSPSPPPLLSNQTPREEFFLERCSYCKKKIEEGSDIYMYGSLSAYCKAECRDAQMEIDRAAAKEAQEQLKAAKKSRSRIS